MTHPHDASDQAPSGPKSFLLTPELAAYVECHSIPVDAPLAALIERTRALGSVAGMQIAPEQGALLTLMVRMLGARQAIEVGTFTGYSSICIARGLADGGRLVACDRSDEWTTIAKTAWLDAGVADKIDLRLGPATETLRALPTEEAFDFAFIDADKGGYLDYYEQVLVRLRPGGVIVADNVLWGGQVVDPAADDPDTVALRSFNAAVAADERVDTAMLSVADGLLLIHKR